MSLPSQVLTATLFEQSKKVADAITKNNAVMRKLDEKGKIKKVSGGYEFREPVMFQDSGAQFFSGLETLDTSISDDMTYAEYDVKQLAEVIGISGRDYRANKSSKHQLIDLLATKIEAGQARLKNAVVSSIYSDGTAQGGKELTGLQALVSKTPTTGTVAGIDRSANTFWRNAIKDIGAASSSANVQSALVDLITQTQRGGDRPDMAVADNAFWTSLHDSMTSIQRIVDEKKSGFAGFQSLVFMGIPVILDGGVGNQAAQNSESDLCYVLNCDYLCLKVHPDAYFTPLGKREPINQDGMFEILLFEGNLCMSNAELQGVVFGS